MEDDFLVVEGYVSHVFNVYGGGESIFMVKTRTVSYKCINKYFSWVDVGDYVRGTVRKIPFDQDPCFNNSIREIYILVRFMMRPLVQPIHKNLTEMDIKGWIVKGNMDFRLYQHKFYTIIDERYKELYKNSSPEKIANYISVISEIVVKDYNYSILKPILSYDSDDKKNTITLKMVKRLLEWWYKNKLLRSLYLLEYTDSLLDKCNIPYVDVYWKSVNNPWTLTFLSREQINNLIERTGYRSEQREVRLYEIVKDIYNILIFQGNTSVSIEYMSKKFPDLSFYLEDIVKKYDVYYHNKYFYMKFVFGYEKHVLDRLHDYQFISDKKLGDAKFIEGGEGLKLTAEQQTAIQGAMENPICIITGGPGTGKTTCIKELIANYSLYKVKYLLLSPTGRATSRMKMATENPSAYTLHRAIAFKKRLDIKEEFYTNYATYRNNVLDHMDDRQQLEELVNPEFTAAINDITNFNAIIIDESSMLTIKIMSNFFKVFPHNYRIVFVGDVNQLDPVEWGSMFDVLYKSRKVPVFHLTENLRQGDNIIDHNCKMILCPGELVFTKGPEFMTFDGDISIVNAVLKAAYDNKINPKDLKVITPLKEHRAIINKMYSELYDQGYDSIKDKKKQTWRYKDLIMMTENKYSINMFNGEEGEIIDVDPIGKYVHVKFYNDQLNKFTLQDDSTNDDMVPISLISLSYCLTVHQSQGGEWPFVIFYYPKLSYTPAFCNQKLIYTALSRAKKIIWCIGDIPGLKTAAKKQPRLRNDSFTSSISNMTFSGDGKEGEVMNS